MSSTSKQPPDPADFGAILEGLNDVVAELRKTVRAFRRTAGEETLELRSHVHELEHRVRLLERSAGEGTTAASKVSSVNKSSGRIRGRSASKQNEPRPGKSASSS